MSKIEHEEEHVDADFKPEVRLHIADVQLLAVCKEEDPPEQQEWSPCLDQEDPPELPCIKEEQEELWTSQEGEQLRALEEAEITKFTFTPVLVKSEEDNEEKPQSSQLHQSQTEQMKSEPDGEDCGGSEPARNLNPAAHDKTSHSSEPETDDSCDWDETRGPKSDLNSVQNKKVLLSDKECNTGKMAISSSECAKDSGHKRRVQKHNGNQTEEKPFSCSVCGKKYHLKNSLTTHMRLHSEGKRFSCSICKKTFQRREDLETHMRIHTGEKPFSCPFCGKGFIRNLALTSHIRVHTGEKPFTCSVCKASFGDRSNLTTHMRMHTGEKPFSCSDCGKTFARKIYLKQHLTVHTGEKPFGCSICDKRFTRFALLRKHRCAGESSECQ